MSGVSEPATAAAAASATGATGRPGAAATAGQGSSRSGGDATPGEDAPPGRAAGLHHRPALDGLRGLAALWVLAYHCWIRTGAGALDGLGPVAPLIRTGTLGVEVFFVLSGCILALRLLEAPAQAPWRPFVVRRLARLLPAVWLALAVAVATASLHQSSTEAMRRSITPESILANGTLLAGLGRLVPGYDGAVGFVVNPVVWSLTPELLFSLVLVPFLPLLRRAPVVVLGLLVVAGVALRLADPSLRLLSVMGPLLTGFPLGLAAALVITRWPSARRFAAPLAGVALLVLLAVVETRTAGTAGAMKDAFARSPVVPAIVSAACAALCVALATARSTAGLASPPLVALGRWSYGIYLWHFPIIGVLVWTIGLPADGTNRSVALAFLLAAPLAILSGAASHRLVEQPARRWASRRTVREG